MANMATLFRRYAKGSGLLNSEVDFNWDTISAYVNAQAALLGISLNDDGSLKRPLVVRGTSSGGSQDYAIAVDGTYATAADLAGLIILMRADVPCAPTTSSDWPTLTINSTIGPINIKKLVDVLPARGDIIAGMECILTYDPIGLCLILHNPATNARENYAAATGTTDFVVTVGSSADTTFEVPFDWYPGYSGFFKPASSLAVSSVQTFSIVLTSPAHTLAAKTLKKYTNAAKVALQVGDITADGVYGWVYDGTDVILLNPNPDPIIYRSVDTVFTTGYNVPLSAVVHGLGGMPDFCELLIVNRANIGAGGYTVGDQVPAWCVTPGTAAASPNPFVIIYNNLGTTFTVVKTAVGAANYVMSNKAGSAEVSYTDTQFAADWTIRVVLGRYKRSGTGAAA